MSHAKSLWAVLNIEKLAEYAHRAISFESMPYGDLQCEVCRAMCECPRSCDWKSCTNAKYRSGPTWNINLGGWYSTCAGKHNCAFIEKPPFGGWFSVNTCRKCYAKGLLHDLAGSVKHPTTKVICDNIRPIKMSYNCCICAAQYDLCFGWQLEHNRKTMHMCGYCKLKCAVKDSAKIQVEIKKEDDYSWFDLL
jgi:hypothetical protein